MARPAYLMLNPSWRIKRWEKRPVLFGLLKVSVPIFEFCGQFRVVLEAGGFAMYLTIQRGEETDFASIPPIFWPILPPIGPWALAAAAHDHLYKEPKISRFLADAVFRDLMSFAQVAFWQKMMIYLAVRFCGASHKRDK